MIGAQIMLMGVAFVLVISSTYPDMPKRWRVAMLAVAALHATPLLITMWRYALLGGGE